MKKSESLTTIPKGWRLADVSIELRKEMGGRDWIIRKIGSTYEDALAKVIKEANDADKKG